jgi:hypothetical protein
MIRGTFERAWAKLSLLFICDGRASYLLELDEDSWATL